jgi:hypothetical protein
MGWMPSSSAISLIPPLCSGASCNWKQNLKAESSLSNFSIKR